MELLSNLPKRGYFTDQAATLQTPAPVYMCYHDTAPPDDQVIRTDPTNILIRGLSLKKAREDALKSKRQADGSTEERPPKRASGGRPSLEGMTVEKLKALLRENGLPTKGKKDELLERAQCITYK